MNARITLSKTAIGIAAVGVLLLGSAQVAPLGAAVAAGIGIYQATLQEAKPITPEISTAELQDILAKGSAVVFDARPYAEYAISHIPGALNAAARPGVSKAQYVSDVAEVGRVVNGDKTKAIVLYCNGPFCPKSKLLSEELKAAGYTNVRRYQLGAPVWRALAGTMQIEPDGIKHVFANDRTSWLVDARDAQAFAGGTVANARNIPLDQVAASKGDGRLPMQDHNTRILVFGADGKQARAVAAELAKSAFHNVTFFDGDVAAFQAAVSK